VHKLQRGFAPISSIVHRLLLDAQSTLLTEKVHIHHAEPR